MGGKPLRLDKAMTEGYLRTYRALQGTGIWVSPPPGYAWLILSGKISHVTGTMTRVVWALREEGGQRTMWLTDIPLGNPNGLYPMFSLPGAVTPAVSGCADNSVGQFSILLGDDEYQFSINSGAVGSYCDILVLEWKP